MFAVLLLILICSIAFFKPRIGLVLFLILHATLFNLGANYLTVSLGFGYIGTGDILPGVIILSAIITARQKKTYLGEDVFTKRIVQILTFYLIWSCIGLLLGIVFSEGAQQIKFAVRYFVTAVMYWGFFYVAIIFGDSKITPKRILITLTVIVALLDLVIKVAEIRPIMLEAYGYPGLPEYHWLIDALLYQANYGWFRAAPQGFGAIQLVGVYLLMYFLCNQLYKSKYWLYLLGATLCILTYIVSVHRAALVVTFAAIFLSLIIIYFLFKEHKKTVYKKTLGILTYIFVGYMLITMVSPEIIGTTGFNITERFQSLKDEIAFTRPDSGPRGWDNAASVKAIADSPIYGVGYSRYPDVYSIRPDYSDPTDIMPVLVVGLVCGIPGMLLVTWLLVYIAFSALRIAFTNRLQFGTFMPCFSVFLMALIKTFSGAGAFLERIPLVAYALLLGCFLYDVKLVEQHKSMSRPDYLQQTKS